MWNPDQFFTIEQEVRSALPDLIGIALIAADGSLLLHSGQLVSDARLIGATTAAICRLADHLASELGECDEPEICIRCREHRAIFYPLAEGETILLILPAMSQVPANLRSRLR